MNVLAVFIGGGIGSICRYGISLLVLKNKFPNFPLATFIANMLACLFLALLVFVFKDKLENTTWLAPLLFTGFCGGFSTFSSFSLETFELISLGNYGWAIVNVLVSVLLGIGIIFMVRS